MSTSYAKPLAIVTGASSGIGFELAKIFALNGFDLVITAEDEGIDIAHRALDALGAIVQSSRVDLSSHKGVESFWILVKGLDRSVAAVAINAGVGLGGNFVEMDMAQELKLIDLNVASTVHLTKLVVLHMLRQRSGRILFTTAVTALSPSPAEVVFGASKAFVHAFAQGLRGELEDSGITITSLLPGPTETNFSHRAAMDHTKFGSSKTDDSESVARQGFEALMEGKDKVVAGAVKNRVLASKLLPEAIKAATYRREAREGSTVKA